MADVPTFSPARAGKLRLPWREVLLASAATLLAAGLFELGGQVYAYFHPAYEVLYLEPDRVVGWKEVPNLKWIWAGRYWYANEFSVAIESNAFGFRDAQREVTKPANVRRVALLGDSYIEALQVPFEKTAGQLLERQLNQKSGGPQFEVLNFGISGYGLGQELLAWQEYAQRFSPDFVFALCAPYLMRRTTGKKAGGGFPGTAETELWVRPVFHLDDDRLVLDPAPDFDAFVEKQQFAMQTVFGGKRSIRRPNGSFLGPYLSESWNTGAHGLGVLLRKQVKRPVLMVFRDPSEPFLALNLKILEELGRQSRAAGCRLVIVDVSRYFSAESALPPRLRRFCDTRGFGYLPLSDDLLAAERKGLTVQLPLDTHFTELGNRIAGDGLYKWMATNGGVSP